MPRIQPVVASETDANTTATLEAVKRNLGTIPNLFSTLARSPTALNSYLQFSETLTGGRLNAAQREIIALTVAQANECQYCLSAHTLLGKNAGLDAADVERARRGTADDPLNSAIAKLARLVTENRGVIKDSDLVELRMAGLDDGLILETTVNVVLNLLTNYVNHIAQTSIDFPIVDLKAA